MRRLTQGVLGSITLVTAGCQNLTDPPRQFLDLPADAAMVDANPATEIFFTDAGTGKIWRATMNSSGALTSAIAILQRTSPVGIALNGSGKMYWTDNGTNTIERALSNPPFTVDPPLLSGLSAPLGIALDAAAGKMYFVEETAGTISNANLNGSQKTLLVSGLGDGRYIALDGVDRMYWSDAGFDEIGRSTIGGLNRVHLIPGQIGPYGLAIDRVNRALYWADNSLGTIQKATVAGGVQPPFITGIPAVGIALDLAASKIYWAANASGKIQRANLDGSNIEDLVTGLSNPHGIALRSAAITLPSCSLIATGPDVWVRFSSNGGVESNDTHWYATLFGVAQQFLFNNGTGVPGTELKINHTFAAGDEVFIGMLVNTQNQKYWTGPASRNPDGVLHFRGSPLVNDPKYQIHGGFEETLGGGDNDFDDLVIDIGGVQCR